jgi:hypothetical protein
MQILPRLIAIFTQRPDTPSTLLVAAYATAYRARRDTLILPNLESETGIQRLLKKIFAKNSKSSSEAAPMK